MVNVNLFYRDFDSLPVLIISSKIIDLDTEAITTLSSLDAVASEVNDKTFDKIYSISKQYNHNGFLEPERNQPYKPIPEDVMAIIKNLLLIK
jgi:hypothetical protein